jgi:hypothetical protein
MKIAFLLLSFLLSFQAFGQTNYSCADSVAAHFNEPYAGAADLAQKLTRSFQTEEEKARVLFMWIAHNIRYDCSKYKNPPRPRISAASKEELDKKIEVWYEKEMARSLKGKRGICSDYSRMFKAMCDAAGLEAVILTGVSRDFYRPYRNAQDNSHAWNAVKIDGVWHLLDATWAAGYVNPEVTKFTRKVAPGHFKTPPAWFAQSHLPEDEKWQLMDAPVSKKSFPDQPLINYGQTDYPVEDFSLAPQPVGDGYEIRLKLLKMPKEFQLATANSRPVDFKKTEENGWVVLRFSKRTREVVVFGGESLRSKMDWLARYEVR